MKTFKTSAIGVLLIVCYLNSSAQKIPLNENFRNQPKLFADMPGSMKLKTLNLESLLDLPVGTSVNTFLTNNFNFQGTVVSTSPASNATVKSIVVQSTNRKGATLTFTRTVQPDGTIKYLGRIISLKNGDAFDIVKENDQYILQKKNLDELVNE